MNFQEQQNSFINELLAKGIKVKENLLGKNYTTFCIGGNLACLIEPENIDELKIVIKTLSNYNISFKILGAGSNLLISSLGIFEPIIKLGKGFRYCNHYNDKCFIVGGSMSLMSLSRDLSNDGLSGLEFAGGIPASIGGAVKMNAGAHNSEMANIIRYVTFMNEQAEVFRLSREDIDFSYRNSNLPNNIIITEIEIEMATSTKDMVLSQKQEFLRERKLRQPLNMPSAGPIFKNPDPRNQGYAGKLIEEIGDKGYKYGGASVSELHCNWIVNPLRTAISDDVKEIIAEIKKKVLDSKGISLETEIIYW